MLCQGQRGILEWRFPHPGKYMFHAHQSEFTELGWQGFFEVGGLMDGRCGAQRDDARDGAAGCRPGCSASCPLLLIVAAIGAFAALGGPGLGERRGPPAEELASSARCCSPARSS